MMFLDDPPCCVGDILYVPWTFGEASGIALVTVLDIVKSQSGIFVVTDLSSDCEAFLISLDYGVFKPEEFGKKVFLNLLDIYSKEGRNAKS